MKPLPFLAIVVLGATLLALEAKAELPARNLDFETWSADGKPEGWWVGSSPAHTISADCESAPKTYDAVIYIDTVTPPEYR